MENKLPKIMEVAERMVREGGYNAFSFREIATEVGVKSASIHYHFPTKADLGAELARQYTQRFMAVLGEPAPLKKNGSHPIKRYIKAFKDAILKDGRMCLCGMLGAESKSLPLAVQQETRAFFEANLKWLKAVYENAGDKPAEAEQQATLALSLLEGASLVSTVMKDGKAFRQAEKILLP